MTRSLHWTQTPANLDDYSADCIQPKGMAPFQLAPSVGDQGKTVEGDVKKRGGGVQSGSVPKVPKMQHSPVHHPPTSAGLLVLGGQIVEMFLPQNVFTSTAHQ